MLSVIMLSVIMLSGIVLSLIMQSWVSVFWVSVCWVSVCWVFLCWVSLCSLSLCWVSWRRSKLNCFCNFQSKTSFVSFSLENRSFSASKTKRNETVFWFKTEKEVETEKMFKLLRRFLQKTSAWPLKKRRDSYSDRYCWYVACLKCSISQSNCCAINCLR